MLLYSLVAGLAAFAWLPASYHLSHHPELLKQNLPAGIFASQVKRPVTSIVCQMLAALLGWFFHPFLAVCLFVLVVFYHTWTSQGPFRRDEAGDSCSNRAA